MPNIDPAQLATPRTLDALTAGQDPGAMLRLNNMAAGQVSNTASPLQNFNLKLMDMLKQYQSLGTGQFQNAQLNASDQQAQRVLNPATQGMSPSQQSQVTSAQAGALDPTIQGASNMTKTFGEQISGLGNLIDSSRALLTNLQNADQKKTDDARQALKDMIVNYGGEAIEQYALQNPKDVAELEKHAGYPKGFLLMAGRSIKEREMAQKAQQDELNNQNKLQIAQQADQTRLMLKGMSGGSSRGSSGITSTTSDTNSVGADISTTISSITNPNIPISDVGGLTKNGLIQAAKTYLTQAKMPSLGLGQSADVKKARQAIVNYSGYLAEQLGMDAPTVAAFYKANAKAASTVIERMARIDTVGNTLTAQVPRLAELAQKVGNLGITESDITAGKAAVTRKFGSVDAGNYVELLQTVRGDYAAMQSALAGGRGGQMFVQNAQEAIPAGLTPDQYMGIMNTLQVSVQKANDATKSEANDLLMGSGSGQTGLQSLPSKQIESSITNDIKQAIKDKNNFPTREALIAALAQHYGISQDQAGSYVYSVWTDNTKR